MENDVKEVKTDDRKLLLAVAFSNENNTYIVDIPSGSSVSETAFCMSVVIKCLIRDNIIKDSKEVTDLITKYLNDPQYQELKGE